MDKTNMLVLAVAVPTTFGLLMARGVSGEGYDQRKEAAEFGESQGYSASRAVKAVYSDCRRHGVVWSGGIALRQPDRIGPRPVRSRWQDSKDSRIFCTEGDPFTQKRVADTPWVR
jgi:hypothetical protein